ncbi:O-antigen ligase family protein [Phyllobacterium salinisoli]|uniref:O-antigen ligase family protein n=1 Tax=Phyllobacterium salinisoli TaxID=1899321 RepID=A0A368K8B8_9HYPH|nr:O-antigen ligase [Phyllobacterium salinisoli]RCS24662.1 O-antigen ligase family protein [Phyllobacterium salinisoli]
MSNIASLRRTDRAAISMRMMAALLAALILSLLLISFRPFFLEGTDNQGGDLANQLGFSGLGVVAILSMLMLAKPRTIIAMASPLWLVMFCFVVFSALISPVPTVALRAVAFTLIAMISIISVLCLPRDGDGFSLVLMVSAAVVLILSYAGIVLLPNLATHGYDALEPQNSYLWRGVFSHKNVAGPVMAAFFFAGIYLMRRRWFISGALVALAALFFVAQTGSKTTTALVPLVAVLVGVPGILGLRLLVAPMILAAQIGFFGMTLGVVLFPSLARIVQDYLPEPSFTGRSSIWRFTLEYLEKKPWTGYGLGGFWSTPTVLYAARPYYLEWDVRGIVHAHNGYLDIAVTMGIPAAICAVIVIILMPLIDYSRCRSNRENVLLADFFLMVLAFSTLNAFLESFFFRRADPVWLMLVLAIFGLRMTARVTLPPHEK